MGHVSPKFGPLFVYFIVVILFEIGRSLGEVVGDFRELGGGFCSLVNFIVIGFTYVTGEPEEDYGLLGGKKCVLDEENVGCVSVLNRV